MTKVIEKLKPDYFLAHYSDITVTWLKERDIQTIISDLDGTLAKDNEAGDEEFIQWLQEMNDAEINIIIASNNKDERVSTFSRSHHLVGYGECQKPFGKKIHKELLYKGLDQGTTMFLGDQIFTDVLYGKRLGLRTCLVTPIPCQQPLRTKCKRGIEKLLLRKWRMAQ